MKETIKEIFKGIFSRDKMFLNTLCGIAMGILPFCIIEQLESINQSTVIGNLIYTSPGTFIFGFIYGYILSNMSIKETNILSFYKVLCSFPLLLIWLFFIYLLW